MSDSPQTPDTQPSRRKPWLTIIMGFLFLTGILYWWAGARVILYGRSLVAMHHAQKVQEKISQKDWTGAGQSLRQARSWRVDHPQVLRAYADLLIATHSDNLSLLQVLRALESLQQATPQDRLRMGQILIALGHISEAHAEYAKLPETQRQTPDGMELLAHLYSAEGRKEESEKLMRRALALAPADAASKLKLAVLDYQNTFPEIQARAQETLWEIAQTKDDTGLRALEFLATQVRLNGPEAEKLQAGVAAHPMATASTRYMALSARLRARPQDRSKVLEEEVQRVRGQGVDALTPALGWLLQENEPASVIELLSGDLYLKSATLLHSYLLALSAMDRWAEIDTLLATQKALPVSETFLHLWKARAAEKLDKGIHIVRHQLEAAFAQTGRGQDETSGRITAETAEQMGLWDLASRYYDDLAQRQPLNQGPLLEKVHEMALRGRDTDAALSSSLKLAALHPENQIFAQNSLYLALMAGRDIEANFQAVEKLSGSLSPGPDRATLVPLLRALAAYRLGQMREVKKHLAQIADRESLTPGQKAACAGLLAVCGEIGQAYQLAEKIPAVMLLPEELRFLKRAL